MQSARARVLLSRALIQQRTALRSSTPSQRYLQLRRSFAVEAASAPSSSSVTPPPPPPPEFNQSKWKRFLQFVGRATLVSVVGSATAFYVFTQRDRNPGAQMPFDPEKKTVVVLGSGWGATSLLNTLDTTDYNVVVISPKNYFLFTPLLPSVAVGTLSPRSIIQPTRYVTRHKARAVSVVEAEATDVDPTNKTVTFVDNSQIKGEQTTTTIKYDYLVYGVGAEVQTFNIPGVKEHAVFMKELHDAERMQREFMDCLETAAFPGQSSEEIDRLLHMVVVGGGPTGVELSGELHDFLEDDLKSWYPELAGRVKITLVEAMPSVLPMFSKELISYTESTFKESKIDILLKTAVKEVKPKSVILSMPDKTLKEVPCGLVVWAAGNKSRKITLDLMAKFPEDQKKRALDVDDHLRLKGDKTESIFALGDCTATSYAPTAQVASQQGAYLARVLNQIARKDALADKLQKLEAVKGSGVSEEEQSKIEKEISTLQKKINKINPKPFNYSHQGSLAYIGSEKAIADLVIPGFTNIVPSAGVATFLFWRSAYLSTLFSLRNRTLVATDWLKVKLFGRDVSRD